MALFIATCDDNRHLRQLSRPATCQTSNDLFKENIPFIYIGYEKSSCNHNVSKSQGATGVFLEISSKCHNENSENRNRRRESLNVCKQGLRL